MKCLDFRAQHPSYEGQRVGWVKKTLDEVVLIEEAWTSEVNKYLAENGYDELLVTVAKILDRAGQPPISRAQAWVILHDITNKGVPEALRDAEADEKIGLGKLTSSIKKSAVGAVDTVTAPVGKVVGGATKAVGNTTNKIVGKKGESTDGGDTSE